MADKPRLLDLFCCAGGAAMGYSRAGFEVVGIDLEPQPHYPFEFHQADALTYPLEGFDAYHASPPCQAYSQALNYGNKDRTRHPDLVAAIRELLVNTGKPFVIENVPNSPLENYIILDGTMFGLKTIKRRWFELHGFDITLLPMSCVKTGAVKSGEYVGIMGHSKYPNERCKREDLEKGYQIDWGMNRHELRQAIPPAYTEFIGKYLIKYIGG
jgi:DNA (cytosine-5)-methyltransferase 1